LWDQAPDWLQTLLTYPERKANFAAQVEALAIHLVELHDANPDFSIYRAVRQEQYKASNYGHAHCVHTATLCILLARHLRWPQQRLMSLVKAALTMNMTILKSQSRLAMQSDPLNAAQRVEVIGHPQQSVALLEKLGVTDAHWLRAVAQHHEHQDGSGYPAGCTEIDEMANVLHVCDVFMAKISPRMLRPALSPQEAIRQLYREDSGGPIATALIKTFGIYPPGDFVQLASGELGIVVERTANAKAPIVAAITDGREQPVTSTVRRDTRQAGYAVVGVASDKTMLARLLPERLYGFSIALPLRLPFAGFLVD
jgi:HD-GYP domain-containing protein (c-di-GMP phosphodiesterase class II)